MRGGAVYTLSEKASNQEAQRLAEKENAVDVLAGAESTLDGAHEVDLILADLKWREAGELSADFRGRLLTHLKRATTLLRDPARSAAFVVLRQSDCPSVLVELGFVSNAEAMQRCSSRRIGKSGWPARSRRGSMNTSPSVPPLARRDDASGSHAPGGTATTCKRRARSCHIQR